MTHQGEFEQYEQETKNAIAAVGERIENEKAKREYVARSEYPLEKLKKEITEALQELLGKQEIEKVSLSVPPAHIAGDFALEVFEVAKKLGEKPGAVAERVAKYLNEHESVFVKEARVAGAFVNLETKKEILYKKILGKIVELGDRYGESDAYAGKVALVDYSGPNIAKPIGVGHLRSTIIGQALSNIYNETGYSVIRDNHLGDWGTQFGSLLYAYKAWGDEEKIAKNPIRELKDLYVKFHKFSEENPEAKNQARELFTKLEQKDPGLVALWKRFRDLSVRDFERVYGRLGIQFDTAIGESYFIEESEKIAEECLAKGIAKKDEASGAAAVESIGELPSFLLRKQDGSTLYLTRDLATLQFRIQTFHPDTILYVVGNEQELHFKQLFALARLAGYFPDAAEVKHIGFGMVLREGKKMSTRKGTLIELEDLISQSIEKSKKILLEKNPSMDSQEMNTISEILGAGAILYNDLRQTRTKNISFDWEKMLDLEGGSAVYLQYSYVRVNSIVRKITETYGVIDRKKISEEDVVFENNLEFDLAKKLMMFPEVVMKARETDSPHHICGYLEELALLFNSFYNEVSILKTEDKKLRDSRVLLSQGVALVIKKGLALLNIKVPERM